MTVIFAESMFAPTQPSDFAREIAEDYHQELLERGNLNKRKQIPFTPRWTDTGYIARIVHTSCTRCGSLRENPPHLFHSRTDQAGDRQLSPVKSTQLCGDSPRKIERTVEKTDACALCLPSLGFTES